MTAAISAAGIEPMPPSAGDCSSEPATASASAMIDTSRPRTSAGAVSKPARACSRAAVKSPIASPRSASHSRASAAAGVP